MTIYSVSVTDVVASPSAGFDPQKLIAGLVRGSALSWEHSDPAATGLYGCSPRNPVNDILVVFE